jgi:AcrR family transcriptional regulator
MKKADTIRAKTAVRRREIIQAALACFSERGFTDTSLADIRRMSKASTGSIYHHFKGKEQLAAEVYLEGIREYQAGFVDALEEQQGAREGIHAVVNFHLRWVEAHPDWTLYLFQRRHADFMASSKEEFYRLNTQFMRRCFKWFSRQVEAGALRRLPLDLYISVLIGPCMEHTRWYLAGHASMPMDQAIEALSSAAWRALGLESGKG